MSTQKGKQVDATKVGKVNLNGDSAYRIEIEYVKEEHPWDCVWCKILRSRDTGTEYQGISETANALSVVLEYFKHDIVNSEMYSHCRIIRVAVFRRNGSEWVCIEEHEVTK
jgi:hypothetical protein